MTLLMTESEALVSAGSRGAERRRGLRIRQARPVKVFQATAARYFGGQTEDISTTGLRVELPATAPLGEGDMLSIHVGPSRMGQALANFRQMMPARVVWVDRVDSMQTGRISAGIEFVSNIEAHLDAA